MSAPPQGWALKAARAPVLRVRCPALGRSACGQLGPRSLLAAASLAAAPADPLCTAPSSRSPAFDARATQARALRNLLLVNSVGACGGWGPLCTLSPRLGRDPDGRPILWPPATSHAGSPAVTSRCVPSCPARRSRLPPRRCLHVGLSPAPPLCRAAPFPPGPCVQLPQDAMKRGPGQRGLTGQSDLLLAARCRRRADQDPSSPPLSPAATS